MKIKFLIALLIVLIAAGCSSQDKNQTQTAAKQAVYYCPMHPQVTSNKAGSVCPICQMDLVLKGDDNAVNNAANLIKLSEGKQILANVITLKITKEKLLKEIRSFGTIDFAEPNKRSITARFNGRIEKLYINKVGDIVKEGTPLFDIYSPDLVQAQNEFLISNGNPANTAFAAQTEKKLLLLGFTKEQVNELQKSKEVKTLFTYHSPFAGTVLEKKLQEGTYVNEGNSLYEIADLSTVWNISEVFTEDLSYIRKGMQIKITSNSYPNEPFNGIVDFIYPTADQQNKTVKVRTVVNNSGFKLRPNIYTEASFKFDLGSLVSVPVEAVIMTGQKNIVWVKKSMNEFELREIKLGAKVGNKYQVINGLQEGEEIAATGGYLIDSENQLKGGTASGHDHSGEAMPAVKEADAKSTDDQIVRKGVIDLKAIDANKDGKVYQDLMDWNVLSDKPGKCPLCGMILQKVTLDEAKKNLEINGFKVK